MSLNEAAMFFGFMRLGQQNGAYSAATDADDDYIREFIDEVADAD